MTETEPSPTTWARQRAQMRQIIDGGFERAFPQAPWRTQTRNYAILAALGLLLLVLGWLVLTETTETALIGRRVEMLRGQSAELYRQNQALRLDIAQRTAIQAMYQRAFALGFTTVPAEQVESLVVQGYTPPAHNALPETVTLTEQSTATEETLSEWLQRTYNDWFVGQ